MSILKNKLLILLFLLSTGSFAQKRYAVGLDFGQSIKNNFNENRGFEFKPHLYVFKDSSQVFYKFSTGYSQFNFNNVSAHDKTSGVFLKGAIGIAKQSNSIFLPYIGLYTGLFGTEGQFTLYNGVNGEYTEKYKEKNMFTLGLEPGFDLQFFRKYTLQMVFSNYLTVPIISGYRPSIPRYYTVGQGKNIFHKVNFNTTFSLVYKLP